MATLSLSSPPLLVVSSNSSTSPSSNSSSSPSSSSSTTTEVTISGELIYQRNEACVSEEKSKMSRCFLGWVIFACLDFFFFIPGGFLLAIIGYNLNNVTMLVSGAILIFIFLIVIPGFGLGLVMRRQVRDANKTVNTTRRVDSHVGTDELGNLAPSTLLTPPINFIPPIQYAPLSKLSPSDQLTTPNVNCVVSTSGNHFRDFIRDNSNLVAEEIPDYLSCNNKNNNNNDDDVTINHSTTTSNFIRNIFNSRSGERTGYVELP